MNRTALAFLGIFAVACAVTAREDPRIERIRRLYQEALRMEAADAPLPVHEVKFESILAAIGNQTTQVTFVYTSWQASPEKDPYLLGHRLLKVNVRYNIAAMSGYLVEYLYDEKERPVFYYFREERDSYRSGKKSNITNERRYYFDGNALIMAMVNGVDDDGKAEQYIATRAFNKNDLSLGGTACRNAERYLKFFRHMVEIERLK